jgi:hypothetical protein
MVVYEWRKGTTVIASGAAATGTYVKAGAVIADTGAYQVLIKDAVTNAVLAQSNVFNVTVASATVMHNPATLMASGMTFYMTYYTGEGTETLMSNAFCKAKHGATATAVSFLKLAALSNVPRALYYGAGACSFYNLTNGICGFNAFLFTISPYRIECRP